MKKESNPPPNYKKPDPPLGPPQYPEYHLVLRKGEPVIPERVLKNILEVYEFGKREDLGKSHFPTVIKECLFGADWTTWESIYQIREQLKERNI